MKKGFFILTICLFLGLSLVSASIIFPAIADNKKNVDESRIIPYPAGYDTTSEGASSYGGISNVKNSQYYSSLDFYNMKSTKSLIILSKYKTYQQTTEVTCGPAAALTVLYYFGNTSWDELKMAKIMETDSKVGTSTSGMVKFFKKIGWDVRSSLTADQKDSPKLTSTEKFKDFVIANLKNNTPIMVENIDWGGHWRVIIGYDTMGTETIADDVLIMADPYDTADHLQDGYAINPVEKFFYMWYDSHLLPDNQKKQQWLTAKPPVKLSPK